MSHDRRREEDAPGEVDVALYGSSLSLLTEDRATEYAGGQNREYCF